MPNNQTTVDDLYRAGKQARLGTDQDYIDSMDYMRVVENPYEFNAPEEVYRTNTDYQTLYPDGRPYLTSTKGQFDYARGLSEDEFNQMERAGYLVDDLKRAEITSRQLGPNAQVPGLLDPGITKQMPAVTRGLGSAYIKTINNGVRNIDQQYRDADRAEYERLRHQPGYLNTY